MPTFSRFTRYFLEVARLGSIRKAAETLHISASAIDRQILNAEAELGVALFERLPSGLRLTAAGELLLGNVQGWDKGLRRLREQVDELQGLRRGHVEIATIDAASEGLAAQAVAELHRDFPRLTFGLHTASNAEVVRRLLAGEADLGLVLDAVAGVDLQVLARLEVPLGLVLPIGHPLAGAASLELGDVAAEGLILPLAPLIVQHHAEVLYRRQALAVQRTVGCNDVGTLKALVRRGVGVGLLSWLDVHQEVSAGSLAFVPLRGRQLKPLVLSLCVASHRQLSRAAQQALQVLGAQVRQLAPSRAP